VSEPAPSSIDVIALLKAMYEPWSLRSFLFAVRNYPQDITFERDPAHPGKDSFTLDDLKAGIRAYVTGPERKWHATVEWHGDKEGFTVT